MTNVLRLRSKQYIHLIYTYFVLFFGFYEFVFIFQKFFCFFLLTMKRTE